MGIINNRLSMSAVTDDLNAKEIVIVNPSDDPTTDLYPGYVMGAQAIFGTVYWILSWFIYIKKNAIFNLKVNDINTITLSWMFENLMSTQYGWVSGSLFITFWVHMFTSLIETIAWLFSGLVHIIYTPRLLAQISPESNAECRCDSVVPLNPLSSRAQKEAYEA